MSLCSKKQGALFLCVLPSCSCCFTGVEIGTWTVQIYQNCAFAPPGETSAVMRGNSPTDESVSISPTPVYKACPVVQKKFNMTLKLHVLQDSVNIIMLFLPFLFLGKIFLHYTWNLSQSFHHESYCGVRRRKSIIQTTFLSKTHGA